MRLQVTCQHCRTTFRVDAKYAGKRGKCPSSGCGKVIHIPEVVTTSEPDELDADWKDESEESIPAAKKSRPPSLSRRSASSSGGGRRKGWKQQSSGWASNPLVWLASAAPVVGLIVLFLVLPKSGGADATDPGVVQASVADTSSAKASPPIITYAERAQPFITKYCVDCHQGMEAAAGIVLDNVTDEAGLLTERRRWMRALDMIRGGIMPPGDAAQPSMDERDQVVKYLDETLFKVDCSSSPDPGRVTIRRLNRAEYNNTVRDLLGVDVRPSDDFPSDDVGYGFDNIGDVLTLPPILMEKYLGAAEKVAHATIVSIDSEHPPAKIFHRGNLERSNVAHNYGPDDSEFGGTIIVSNGGVKAVFDAPFAGKYLVRMKAAETPAGTEHARMELKSDGQVAKVFEVNAPENKPRWFEQEVVFGTPGWHSLEINFVNDFYDDKAKKDKDRNLVLLVAEVKGPLWIDPASYPAAHKRIIAAAPSADRSVADCARFNLPPLMERAFRRPVEPAEVEPIVNLVETLCKEGESFETAMQVAVQAVLISPHFLFRVEGEKGQPGFAARYQLSDYELASRLSYFLWSSMPDDELFALAKAGTLHTDANLDAQVRRMLSDPKSSALVTNFAEQWLQLRRLDSVTPDPTKFGEFNAELQNDMKRETRQLFEFVMREDRSILDFLTADYTFVNNRLAKHYGLPEVQGNEFQKVSLAGTPRSGLLTHASVMTLTSNPGRTSPVKRGKWIMETILNTPPPAPPPNVPELEAGKSAGANLSLRQQMEEHRKNPACASCHKQMDILGFGMENFDAIGRFRQSDGGQTLDVSGTLPSGDSFVGPQQLAQILVQKEQQAFCNALAEKMLTYALGRGLEYYDRCTTNRILGELKTHEFRFSCIVREIVKSEAFRMQRSEGGAL